MQRRHFVLGSLAVGAAGLRGQAPQGVRPGGSITDIEGVKVGHFTETRRPTGCTVLLVEEGATGGVDVRGSAPGTRETDLLNPVNSVSMIHGIVLTGGSAFGLAAADGVMRYLEEKGFGFHIGKMHVPIVPAAVLYDLPVGDGTIRPTAESGYKACHVARGGADASLEQGNVGAGAGATVGKILGIERAMKGGFGTASLRLPNGLVIGAMAAVNAVGDVRDPATGKLLAGARTTDGKKLADVMRLMRKGQVPGLQLGTGANSTICVVATNATLTKTEATKVAQMSHDGLARSIAPVHTLADGDTVFAVATGKRKAEAGLYGIIGALAADVLASAVVSAILHAKSIPGYPSHSELSRE